MRLDLWAGQARLPAALGVAAVGLCLLAPASASAGRTFYVSPKGSDRRAGTSPARPWRTVRRASRANLRPGDTVLLRGRASFAHALMPERSGSPGAPIAFGSYGHGRARLPHGVWFRGRHDLRFDRLALPGAAFVGHGDLISLTRSAIARAGMGVFAAGHDWWIAGNTVRDTGDSGLILLGRRMTVAGNRIEHTGRDPRIGYGKHGIYLNAADARVSGNDVRGFADNGISVRYRNSVVERNRIADGPIGIAWFQYDRVPGTSMWTDNAIKGTTAAGIYVSDAGDAGATRESFVIGRNVLRPHSGHRLDLGRTLGSYTLLDDLRS